MNEVRLGTSRRSVLASLPNAISAIRVPLAAAFYASDALLTRGMFLFAGALSDALDGWLARRLGVTSKTGALLDPLFDKIFVAVALAAFLSGPYLGWLDLLVLICRDLYVGAGFLVAWALRLESQVRARSTGKMVTFLQLVALFVLLLAPERVGVFIILVGVASAAAIVDYTFVGITSVRQRSAA